jgi:NAD(P)-dependent dehydrogenase (short-subunit alcohol dehydrogenase family)
MPKWHQRKKGWPMPDMTAKTVVITGASRGIGAAAARAFAAQGANVVLLARDRDAVAAIAGEIGPRALAVPCDVTRYWEVEAALGAAVAAFGGVDVLISNAGVIDPIADVDAADPEMWSQAIDINLKGVFHGSHAALPLMLQRGGGTLITVSSGAAVNPIEGWSAYCASKAGALMLTQAAHLEEGPHGIRVLGLSPGTVATEMQVKIKASGINPVSQLAWEDHIPPEWPARALVWMCGAAADDWLGRDISLRDDGVRRAVGLIA